jgi:hypothetical protein
VLQRSNGIAQYSVSCPCGLSGAGNADNGIGRIGKLNKLNLPAASGKHAEPHQFFKYLTNAILIDERVFYTLDSRKLYGAISKHCKCAPTHYRHIWNGP